MADKILIPGLLLLAFSVGAIYWPLGGIVLSLELILVGLGMRGQG